MKGRFACRGTHQLPNIMVARHAIHWQLQRFEQLAKVLVCTSAVVLDQVAGDDGEIGAPVTLAIMVQHRGQ